MIVLVFLYNPQYLNKLIGFSLMLIPRVLMTCREFTVSLLSTRRPRFGSNGSDRERVVYRSEIFTSFYLFIQDIALPFPNK